MKRWLRWRAAWRRQLPAGWPGISLFWRNWFALALILLGCMLAWLQSYRALEFEPRALQSARQIASLVNLSRAALRHVDPIARVSLMKSLLDEEEVVRFGPYTLDLGQRQLRKQDTDLSLTTGEFAMLKALVRHPRQPLSRDKLAQLARGREFEPFDRSLDVQVSRLRKLIEEDPTAPRYIQTVWGVGYVFVPEGAG